MDLSANRTAIYLFSMRFKFCNSDLDLRDRNGLLTF